MAHIKYVTVLLGELPSTCKVCPLNGINPQYYPGSYRPKRRCYRDNRIMSCQQAAKHKPSKECRLLWDERDTYKLPKPIAERARLEYIDSDKCHLQLTIQFEECQQNKKTRKRKTQL